jgi:membrane-bound lytic murein transglycosylase D
LRRGKVPNKIGVSFFLTMIVLLSACSTGSQSQRVYSSKKLANAALKNADSNPWRPTQKNSIPVVVNEPVQKWVRLFNGSLRNNFSRWIGRLGYYGPTIEGVLDDEGVPRDLIYLAMIESGFNLSAKSHASAVGPWQFIASTGRMYGLNNGPFVDDRSDLVTASRAAARHLKDLYKIYGDWYLAFAAYNAGPGKVNQAIKRGGTTDYWRLSSSRSRLFRQETKDYVPKVLAALHIVKNYKKYGYNESSFSEPMQFDRVTIPDATDVAAIAKSAGTTEDVIRGLNPALVIGITPPNQGFEVYIPKGAKEEFYRRYEALPSNERVSSIQYRTGKKDTLATVASRYGVSVGQIAKQNGKNSKQKIKPRN